MLHIYSIEKKIFFFSDRQIYETTTYEAIVEDGTAPEKPRPRFQSAFKVPTEKKVIQSRNVQKDQNDGNEDSDDERHSNKFKFNWRDDEDEAADVEDEDGEQVRWFVIS